MARVMRNATDAWWWSLAGVLLSDIVKGVKDDVPSDLYQKTGEWVAASQAEALR